MSSASSGIPSATPWVWSAAQAFTSRPARGLQVSAAYLELKRALAAEFMHDREAYTDAKRPYIDAAVDRARVGMGQVV